MKLSILNWLIFLFIFFAVQVSSVRLITDKDGRLKGFGYAEFGTLAALMDALTLSGEVIKPFQFKALILSVPTCY